MPSEKAVKSDSILRRIFKRYFVDAMGAMALGLFSSLIIGLIISQRSPGLPTAGDRGVERQIPCDRRGDRRSRGLWAQSGPVGYFLRRLLRRHRLCRRRRGRRAGGRLYRRAGRGGAGPADFQKDAIVTGGLAGGFVGPYVQSFMHWFGNLINEATMLRPLPMGIIVGVAVGMALTLPISSAALCIMMDLNGLAAGAAVAGCCAQMVGFAVVSFRENGVGGLLSQGLGTSMLQIPNIMRRPQIWIAPTVASGLCGAVSAALLGMTNNAAGAGMGTSGLVGQFGAIASMGASPKTFLLIGLAHFLLPAAAALAVHLLLRRVGWVREGDMKLEV